MISSAFIASVVPPLDLATFPIFERETKPKTPLGVPKDLDLARRIFQANCGPASFAALREGAINYRDHAQYGPESLSGLEVMCLMFAAFQRVAPQEDIGINLHDAYQKALAMHEAQKRGGR